MWQNESFDRVVRDEEELREKVRYVCSNPLKRWPDQGVRLGLAGAERAGVAA